jgi:acyl-CoA thioester hydrolase
MLKELGLPIEKIEEAGVMLPVVSVGCNYKVPAKLGETLKIVSMINELPRAKLVIKTEIFNPAEQLVCEGEVVLGFINSQTRRPVRCPDALVKIFEENLI